MNNTVITYIVYLVIAVPLTIWVAKTLHKNGRVFLIKSMNNDEAIADSVNHLLVVGFYLVNIGFVLLYLKLNRVVPDINGVFEALSTKLGVVMLVLGAMHFFNIYIFARIERKNVAPLPPARPTYPMKQPPVMDKPKN